MIKDGDGILLKCLQYPGGDSFEVRCAEVKGKDC